MSLGQWFALNGLRVVKSAATYAAIIGGFIMAQLGGWDTALITLVTFLAVDYITGLIVAGWFHNSPKSCTGALESRAGFKGLIRKGVMLLIVLVSVRLDLIMETDFIRSTVIIGFCLNELLSIIENVGLMGIPIPKALIQAMELLKAKSEPVKQDIEE